MKTFRHNPHPVDMGDFLLGKETVIGGKEIILEDWDEEFTETPVPAPTFRSSLLKLRNSVSEKLFSIEFGKISF